LSELDDESLEVFENSLHPVVRDVYAEEKNIAAAYIARRVEASKSWIQEGLTWVPYVGSIFEEDDIGPQAAVSDVNILGRAQEVIQKIESRMNETLDSDVRDGIRQDVRDIWGL
jgi:hypothetical protein